MPERVVEILNFESANVQDVEIIEIVKLIS